MALWLKKLLAAFGIRVGAMPVYTDSQGALKLLKHSIASIKSKHIDVIHNFASGCPARKFALHTVAPIKWWLIVSPSHFRSASSGFALQAWVLLNHLVFCSDLQCYAINFELKS